MSRACQAIFALLLVGCVPSFALEQEAPLRVSLSCNSAQPLSLRFTVQNVSDGPAAAVIGRIVANDTHYSLGQATLVVRHAGEADVSLTYVDPRFPAIAGRLDPWLLMLPPDASYSVSVQADNFRLGATLERYTFTGPTKIQMQLVTQQMGSLNGDMQGLQFIHLWVGTLVSQWIEVPRQCNP